MSGPLAAILDATRGVPLRQIGNEQTPVCRFVQLACPTHCDPERKQQIACTRPTRSTDRHGQSFPERLPGRHSRAALRRGLRHPTIACERDARSATQAFGKSSRDLSAASTADGVDRVPHQCSLRRGRIVRGYPCTRTRRRMACTSSQAESRHEPEHRARVSSHVCTPGSMRMT